jgi:hypothetical protein
LLLPFVLVGCREQPADPPPPPTHKVDGRVVTTEGKPYERGGSIEFRPVNPNTLAARGKVEKDGSFTLSVIVGNRTKVDGAEAGEYEVTIVPFAVDQFVHPIMLETHYRVREGEQKLTVQLE